MRDETKEDRDQEGAQEELEDLEAPASTQDDVVGGLGCKQTIACKPPTAVCKPTLVGACGPDTLVGI